MQSFTVVIGFVCKNCVTSNVQRKRVEATDKESARARITGIKFFCENPDCGEQVFDNQVRLQILASTDEEISSLSLESQTGSA